jgi:hypothetical protein
VTDSPLIAVDVSDWTAELRAEHDEMLRARLGIPLAIDDLNQWLAAAERRNRAHAGDDVADPESTAGAHALLYRRIPIAGTRVVLEPETIAARIRIDEAAKADDEGKASRTETLRAIAYCLAHARDRQALADLATRAQARRTIDAWAAAELTCPPETLELAIATTQANLYPLPDHAPEDTIPADWPAILASLAEHIGATPDHWLYEVPWSQAVWLLRAMVRQQRRRAQKIAQQTGQTSPFDPDSAEVKAIGEYRELKRRLMEAPEMKREKIRLDDNRAIEIREMTYAELRKVQAEGSTLPMEWPLEQQFAGRLEALDGLGVSEIRKLAEAVYRVTFEPEVPPDAHAS